MLRVSDIDSKRMLIWVEIGKGRKDRYHNLPLMRTLLAMAMPLSNATHANKADAPAPEAPTGSAPVALAFGKPRMVPQTGDGSVKA